MPEEKARRIVSLLSDFGAGGGYVGAMKAVILSRVDTHIVDITHDIPPQEVAAGALILRSVVKYFPQGTVHVGVVDPGVGTSRKPIAVKAGGHYFIGPDNGLLMPAARSVGKPEVREINVKRIALQPASSTFHGRDIFAPAAAYLALGNDFSGIGKKLERWQETELFGARRIPGGISGKYVCHDSFGNIITSIEGEEFRKLFREKEKVSVQIGDMYQVLEFRGTYGDVERGKPLILIGSHGNVEIAIREGSASGYFGQHRGSEILFKRLSF